MNPEDAKTLEDLAQVDRGMVIDTTHIIIGGYGKCMCGIYGSARGDAALNCQQIRALIVDGKALASAPGGVSDSSFH